MDLLIVACLIAEPASCREIRIPVGSDATAATVCLAIAPALIAAWADSHSKFQVDRWRCALSGEGGVPI